MPIAAISREIFKIIWEGWEGGRIGLNISIIFAIHFTIITGVTPK